MMNKNTRQFLFGFTVEGSDDCGILHCVEAGETIRGTFDKVKKNIAGHFVLTSFPSLVTFEVRENSKSIFKVEIKNQKTYDEYYVMCVRAWTRFKEDNLQVTKSLFKVSKDK
ncbi:MAG: hypothetical protein ACTSYJ_00535 [Candidatus Thorarchaeota archaeon]